MGFGGLFTEITGLENLSMGCGFQDFGIYLTFDFYRLASIELFSNEFYLLDPRPYFWLSYFS